MTTHTITPARYTAPPISAAQAWGTVARTLATAAGFAAHVWVVAPARRAWAITWVRIAAWCLLLPLVWRLVAVGVTVLTRWALGPLVALAALRFRAATRVPDSHARQARWVLLVMRQGYRRGRRSGARVAALVYR
ncbi:hypothetical protein [Streptomyces palmae]|uniref:Uncharacterized protein n=1 Tax=Streptomyces palmae TaxID=1701085 RepID=A0A4Z0FVC6_9ACTN|nr:hypothetical protein [Streptomyces palmae]TGA85755.1 hypothetical protein E4099_30745 [Streptomyces palmae]